MIRLRAAATLCLLAFATSVAAQTESLSLTMSPTGGLEAHAFVRMAATARDLVAMAGQPSTNLVVPGAMSSGEVWALLRELDLPRVSVKIAPQPLTAVAAVISVLSRGFEVVLPSLGLARVSDVARRIVNPEVELTVAGNVPTSAIFEVQSALLAGGVARIRVR